MTQHVTIALDDQELSRARELAVSLGVSVEEYLERLVRGSLPGRLAHVTAADIGTVIGIGETSAPTHIAQEKDQLVGDAVWREFVEETGRK